MTKRRSISVICAPPNGRNTGMASVDMAFADVMGDDPNIDVTYWRLWDSSQWKAPVGLPKGDVPRSFADPDTGLTYRLLRGHLDEALAADAVVFWGDFLHMAVYVEQTADVLHRRMGVVPDAVAGWSEAAEAYLLHGREDVLRRTLSYGTTLAMNTPHDYLGQYGECLRRFHAGIQSIWHRDPYSAQTARLARAGQETCQGMDAAFLLDAGKGRPRDSIASVFFGRSNLRPEVVAHFSRQLTKRLGVRPRMLPWGEAPAFWPMTERRRFRLAWPEFEPQPGRDGLATKWETYRTLGQRPEVAPKVPGPSELFRRISESSVVITDTYHLAVNAWRLGTPAVLVVDGPSRTWDVNAGTPQSRRDKRHDLFSQLDALGLLVDGTLLGRGSAGEAARVAAYLNSPELINHTKSRITNLQLASREQVSRTLRGLINDL